VRRKVKPQTKRGRPSDQPLPPAAGETLTYRLRLDERFRQRWRRGASVRIKALVDRWVETARTASMEIKLRADAPVEERARWLLGFAFQDPNSLSEGDRLNLREALENFITPPGVSGTRILAAGVCLLPEEKIHEIQQWLRTGLAGLATQKRWSFKAATSVTLGLSPYGLRDFTSPAGTIPTAEAFRFRIFQVLRDAGPRFRLCSECQRPFIAGKGQEYCSTRCSQAVRTRKFRAKAKKSDRLPEQPPEQRQGGR